MLTPLNHRMWNIARAAAKPVKRRIARQMNRRSDLFVNVTDVATGLLGGRSLRDLLPRRAYWSLLREEGEQLFDKKARPLLGNPIAQFSIMPPGTFSASSFIKRRGPYRWDRR
jgi:hypothetical protein